jgi:hypothetical protein
MHTGNSHAHTDQVWHIRMARRYGGGIYLGQCPSGPNGHCVGEDGVAGLLCCEMVAKRGKSLGQQLKELFAKVGSSGPNRQNFRLTLEVKAKFTEKLRVDQQ